MPSPQKHVPRIRKQRARQRAEAQSSANSTNTDSNALEMLPVSAGEREDRRQKLREEYRAARPESKSSAKKRKRLDKYIDTKLKRDESTDLIKKLAAQGDVDTSLFKSSRKLGRGDETRRELMGRTLRERRAGLGGDEDEDILMEERSARSPPRDSINTQLAHPINPEEAKGPASAPSESFTAIGATNMDDFPQNVAVKPFGGGLKRPHDTDEAGRPIIKKRKITKSKSQGWEIPTIHKDPNEMSDEWEGFSDASNDLESGSNVASDGEDIDSEDFSDDSGDPSSDESTSDTSVDEQDGVDLDADGSKQNTKGANKERSNAFKAWATQQRNDALGFQSSNALDAIPLHSVSDERAIEQQQDPHRDLDKHNASALPKVPQLEETPNVFHVAVQRSSEIEEARHALPVVAEEQRIMEAIRHYDTVIVCGSTGSGKTTQVPQFLFEAGYGSRDGPTPGIIGVTQPRRVAAVSMAKRVATELGDRGSKVAHQIRFDSTVSHSTAVKFMTDGVLLREVGQDFTLSKYSVIVLDEAHERSVNTDILIGMLSRIVDTRANLSQKSSKYTPLKLVIMSATLKTANLLDNANLFRKGQPPIIEAEGRQYPVAIHFARKTERDYLEQAFKKVSRGHKKLPPGAMLVFLTGQNEIQHLAKRLRQTFPATENSDQGFSQVRVSAIEASLEDEDIDLSHNPTKNHDTNAEDSDSDSEASLHGLDNDSDTNSDADLNINEDEEAPTSNQKVHLLPLYSQLPADQQMRVFQPAPPNSRTIVLATNVAETSLTIPGVRYVFDCGRAKEKQYDQDTGVQNFDIDWISKASASQRAGRAGRTGPGHCYRLYSSAVYERDFADVATPEIARSPVEGVVLQLKSMGIPNVASFPFPTPPERASLVKAERLLEYLGAIEEGRVTELGKQLALYPLSPRLARMLCVAQQYGLTDRVTMLVAAITVGDVFVPESQLAIREQDVAKEGEEWTEADNQAALLRERRRKEYNAFHGSMSRLDRTSDAVKLLTTTMNFVTAATSNENFRQYTRTKALTEALQLRRQLSAIASSRNPSQPQHKNSASFEPTKADLMTLCQIVAAGYIDQIAQRADLSPTPPTINEGRSFKPKRATDVPYLTLFSSKAHTPPSNDVDLENPENIARQKYVFIHPSSVLAHQSTIKLPQFLVYSHLSTPAVSSIGSSRLQRTRLHPLTPVSASQIISLAQNTPLLEDGKPIGKIESLDRSEDGRERRAVWTVPCLVPGKEAGGSIGWPLPPARKVVQWRDPSKGWVVERVVGTEA